MKNRKISVTTNSTSNIKTVDNTNNTKKSGFGVGNLLITYFVIRSTLKYFYSMVNRLLSNQIILNADLSRLTELSNFLETSFLITTAPIFAYVWRNFFKSIGCLGNCDKLK